MGAEGAVNIVFRREIDAGRRPRTQRAPKLIDEYKAKFANPYVGRRARATSTT